MDQLTYQSMWDELSCIVKHGEENSVLKNIARKYPELARSASKEKHSDMGTGYEGAPPSMPPLQDKMGEGLLGRLASEAGTHKAELAGLGILALPAVDQLQAKVRARVAKDPAPDAEHRRQFMGETAHSLTELGGLGVLAGPSIAHLIGKHANLVGHDWTGRLGQVLRTNVTGGKGFLVAPRDIGSAAASTAKAVVEKAKQISPNVWVHGGKKYLKDQLPPGAL